MELSTLRNEIDKVDKELVSLFAKRMQIAGDVAAYKEAHDMPVLDATRERQKLCEIQKMVDPPLKPYAGMLYATLFEISRSYQSRLLQKDTSLYDQINNAIENTDRLFPASATVACQGTEGAYSQIACQRLFRTPDILYMKTFQNVFSAIESGLCRYGILPLENSSAGSVTQVYDLMLAHKFKIVKSVRLKVDHNLYANRKTTDLSEIREILSHEQAISQCSEFIKQCKDVKVTYCENTAVAAKMVAESGRSDLAAIASQSCAELYGLTCLASDVQDRGNNYTRFICITKNLEIYPGADRTSIMMTLPHKPGALYRLLARVYALGINLIKLESRPLPDRDFEFMFYFDLETSVYSPEFAALICELSEGSERFAYLGSYTEVV